MGEQRMSILPSTSTTSLSSIIPPPHTQNQQHSQSQGQGRPPRPASITSLRHYRSSTPRSVHHQHQHTHSRAQSTDSTSYLETSQPPSPITYFPNPSSFTNNTHSSTHPPPATAAAAARRLSSSSSSTPAHFPNRTSLPPMSSSEAEDADWPSSTATARPRMNLVGIDSAGSSPRTARTSTFDTYQQQQQQQQQHRRRSSVQGVNGTGAGASQGMNGRALSTPVGGYGATHHNPGLGLGPTPTPINAFIQGREDPLASPRRISTSRNFQSPPPPHPATAYPNLQSQSQSGGGGVSHEAYYSMSQPASATTSRFREREDPSNISSLRIPQTQSSAYHSRFSGNGSGDGIHSRHQSINSPLALPPLIRSPTGTVMRRLKKTASAVGLGMGTSKNYDDDQGDGDDDDIPEDDEGQRANGTRVWYSSYVTIDWIHDAIKESSRVRRLRHAAHRSLRGKIANSWDRFQGWLVVTIIGVVTAIIAFFIVRSEMALFDLKEGFCSNSWGTAKRFCCAPHHSGPTGPGGNDEEVCGDWVEWGELLAPKEKGGPEGAWIWGGPEFVSYLVVAIILALASSCMTVYLTSSAQHTTSKDSTFLTPPQIDPSTLFSGHGSGKQPQSSERQPLLDRIASEPITPLSEVYPSMEPPRKIMYYAAGSGIPEIKTILSGFVIHGYLGGWTLITKSAGLALSVASGLSLGKEGPLVHISSCVGNIVSRLFIKFECNEAKRREVLSAACAAGVAVAFGAPVGGVLFSLEEVSYYFPSKVMWRSFWCAAVAAITLKTLNPFGNGSIVLFAVSYTKEYHYWEYVIFILLGVFGGLYGAVFSRLNIIWSREVRNGTWLKQHPIVEVALVTILTTVVSFMNPYTRMGGTELVASLFAECKSSSSNSLCVNHPHEIAAVIWEVGMALLIKGCLTIITFGVKLPAGIFIPSLAVGACFGRIVGMLMELIEFHHPNWTIFNVCKETDCIVPGLYAMVGAAATLAGVTRTTVSLAVIMFELTSTLNYVVPVMLGVLVAKTVADALERKGIYDLVIDLNQLPYLDAKHEYLWGSRKASSISDKSTPILRADKVHTVRSLTGKLLELVRLGMSDSGFPILVKEVTAMPDSAPSGSVGGKGSKERERGCLRIVGFLGMNEMEHALAELSHEPDATLNLMPDDAQSLMHSHTSHGHTHGHGHGRNKSSAAMSIFSFGDESSWSPYDLSRYIDRAPIIVQTHSPLELVQQLFVKLGVRQILITNSRGVYQGLITKKNWLSFLREIEDE